MSKRQIISYIRVSDANSYVVDRSNNRVPNHLNPTFVYATEAEYVIRLLKDNGTPYTASELSDYVSWEWGVDNDWDTDTTPAMLTNSGFTVEDVTDSGVSYGQIRFDIDAFTTKVETILNGAEEVTSGINAELNGYESGITQPTLIVQYPVILRNKLLDTGGGSPPEPTINYYTKIFTSSNRTNLDKKHFLCT